MEWHKKRLMLSSKAPAALLLRWRRPRLVCALGGLTDHNFGLRLLVRGLSPVRRRLFLRAAGLVKPCVGTFRTALHGALQRVLYNLFSSGIAKGIEFFHGVPPIIESRLFQAPSVSRPAPIGLLSVLTAHPAALVLGMTVPA